MDTNARNAQRSLLQGSDEFTILASRLAREGKEPEAAMAMWNGFQATVNHLQNLRLESCERCHGANGWTTYEDDYSRWQSCDHPETTKETITDLQTRIQTAQRDVEFWSRQMRPREKDEVRYSNPRARAKFSADKRKVDQGVSVTTPTEDEGKRVPVGTDGIVIWMGKEEVIPAPFGGRGYTREKRIPPKCLVLTGDGKKFFTSSENLTVLHPWRKGETEEAKIKALEAMGPEGFNRPRRGDRVNLDGFIGVIFWEKDGRCGVKACGCPQKCDHTPKWGRIEDCTKVVPENKEEV